MTVSPIETAQQKRALLEQVGARVRELRKQRGLTQGELARASGVSVRFLGQLEGGDGNISLARLLDVATALGAPLVSLVGGAEAGLHEPLHDRLAELLRQREPAEVSRVLDWARALLLAPSGARVALLGIRGAGKTTVGALLARRLRVPFVELDALVEKQAGLPLAAIFELHGQSYYRRLEERALLSLLSRPAFVLATGGSIVTSAEEFELLSLMCTTVWLRATPEEHWARVVQQGDARPMRKNPRAMDELRALFEARLPLYERAHVILDTSGRSPDDVARDALARLAASRPESA